MRVLTPRSVGEHWATSIIQELVLSTITTLGRILSVAVMLMACLLLTVTIATVNTYGHLHLAHQKMRTTRAGALVPHTSILDTTKVPRLRLHLWETTSSVNQGSHGTLVLIAIGT